MESLTIQSNVRSRRNEARRLLKSCFEKSIFSLVPFEIWRCVVINADAKTLTILGQTCWGFKELIDNAGENSVCIPRAFRSAGQIRLGLKYLQKCAENGDAKAMVHLGFALMTGGWGLKRNESIDPRYFFFTLIQIQSFSYRTSSGDLWFKKAAERGNGCAMALHAENLKNVGEDCEEWGKKALASNHPFGVGYCYYVGIGVPADMKKSFSVFEASAKTGDDEYTQSILGYFYDAVLEEKDTEKALYWYHKSAEQGLARSQFDLACMLRDGDGCKVDKDLSEIWFKKSDAQGIDRSNN